MILTETESKVLRYIRNSLERMRVKHSPVDDLPDEEIVSLYNKMDAIIEDERITRRSFGNFDEMYVLELLRVKNSLLKEIKKEVCIYRNRLKITKQQFIEGGTISERRKEDANDRRLV